MKPVYFIKLLLLSLILLLRADLSHAQQTNLDAMDLKIREAIATHDVDTKLRPYWKMVYVDQILDKRAHDLFQDMIKKIQGVIDFNAKDTHFFDKRLNFVYVMDIYPQDDELENLKVLSNSSGDYSSRVLRNYFTSFHAMLSALTEGHNPVGKLSGYDDNTKTNCECYNRRPERYMRGNIIIERKNFEQAISILRNLDQNLGWQNSNLKPVIDTLVAERVKAVTTFKRNAYKKATSCTLRKSEKSEKNDQYCSKGYAVVIPDPSDSQYITYVDTTSACELSYAEALKLSTTLEMCKFDSVPVLGACSIIHRENQWALVYQSDPDNGQLETISADTSSDQLINLMKRDPRCLN